MDELPVPEIVELTPAPRPPGDGGLGRSPVGPTGVRWAVAVAAIVIVGAVVVGVRWGPFASAIGRQTPATVPTAGGSVADLVPDVLGHAWERPIPVTPDLDQWGSGFLRIDNARLEFLPTLDAEPSTSSVTATGGDSLVVTATAETTGCSLGDRGTYRFTVEGKGSVLTLTASGPDACAAREGALAGSWVRADFPPPVDGIVAVPPGTYRTSSFDPFGEAAASGRLTYTVPAGWEVIDDSQSVFVLHRAQGVAPGQLASDALVALIARPQVAAEFEEGTTCGPLSVAPGVGHRLGDIVRAISSRPGVVSTSPAVVTIGGYAGQMLDLHVAKSWTGGCQAPGGRIVGIPLLGASASGSGPVVGMSADQPLRLILVDLGSGRTLAIALSFAAPDAPFDEQVAAMMPMIENFEFHPEAP